MRVSTALDGEIAHAIMTSHCDSASWRGDFYMASEMFGLRRIKGLFRGVPGDEVVMELVWARPTSYVIVVNDRLFFGHYKSDTVMEAEE